MAGQLDAAFGGGRSHDGDLRRGLAKAMDSYMSSPAVGSGTFAELQGWLTKRVLEDVDQFNRYDETVDYLRPLVRWAAENQTVVSTLNYDECLETAARRASVPVDRAVEEWATTGLLGEPLDGESLRLLKLHGSVDWCFIEGEGFRTTRPENKEWPDVDYEPGIVYGQRGKLRPEGPFLQLLEAFRNELERSARLLVIGYSFGDDHINTLVESWIQRDDSRRMLVVDPSFPEYERDVWADRESVRSDTRKRLWMTFGPERPNHDPRPEVRGLTQSVVQRPPIPSQLYIARCYTKEFLIGLESTPTAMDELFARYKKDPPTVDTYVDPSPAGSG